MFTLPFFSSSIFFNKDASRNKQALESTFYFLHSYCCQLIVVCIFDGGLLTERVIFNHELNWI